jgi:hypothetical protein
MGGFAYSKEPLDHNPLKQQAKKLSFGNVKKVLDTPYRACYLGFTGSEERLPQRRRDAHRYAV